MMLIGNDMKFKKKKLLNFKPEKLPRVEAMQRARKFE